MTDDLEPVKVYRPDRDADAARDALGEASFRAAWEAGRMLSDDAILAEALGR